MVTMLRMPKKKPETAEQKALRDRRVTPTFAVRIPLELQPLLERLGARAERNVTREVVFALKKYLRENGIELPADAAGDGD
ncbi:MAG TPA: hypothetical protein VGE52_01480 [Pirellulales bacterium]